MSDEQTVRILCLDGGGIRGLFSIQFLKNLVDNEQVTEPIKDNFDIIVGTSIGGILALGLSTGKYVDEIKGVFTKKDASGKTNAEKIFPKSFLGVPESSLISVQLFKSGTLYNNDELKRVAQEVLGADTTMSAFDQRDIKLAVSSWNDTDHTPVMFSNVTGYKPFLMGHDQLAVNAALCTSAAPIFFPKITLNVDGTDKVFVDGGVVQNNPTRTALSLAKRLFPERTRACVLSVGTGVSWPKKEVVQDQSWYDYFTSGLPHINISHPSLENFHYFMHLTSHVFMGGVQRLTDEQIKLEAGSIYDEMHYLRFQHEFLEEDAVGLDHSDSDSLIKLEDAANAQYIADHDNISNFIQHLQV